MSMTTQQVAHTLGPWRISGAAEGKGYSISAKRGLVALVRDDTHPLADVTEGQAQANARLIAAAPDLLEALKHADEACSQIVGPNEWPRDKIRAAISKAEHGR